MCNTSMGGPSTTPEKIDISEQCRPVFWAPRYSTPNWLVKLVGNVHYASQSWKGMNWIRNTDLFVIVKMLFVETSVSMRLCFYDDKIWNNESKRRSISWDCKSCMDCACWSDKIRGYQAFYICQHCSRLVLTNWNNCWWAPWVDSWQFFPDDQSFCGDKRKKEVW